MVVGTGLETGHHEKGRARRRNYFGDSAHVLRTNIEQIFGGYPSLDGCPIAEGTSSSGTHWLGLFYLELTKAFVDVATVQGKSLILRTARCLLACSAIKILTTVLTSFASVCPCGLSEIVVDFFLTFRLFILGPKSFLVISDPVQARHLLRDANTNYDKGVLAEILEPIMGKGLIPAGMVIVARSCIKSPFTE